MKIKEILFLFLCLMLFTHCDDTDKHYDRPAWLEGSIADILEKEGRFSKYIECMRRTPYSEILDGAGYYTAFAPNDEAFAKYLTEHGYASVADIPQKEAEAIAAYSLVFSKWDKVNLSALYSNKEFIPGMAYKRKTSYYKLAYKDPAFGNKWVIDQNSSNGTYTLKDNNYKYVPIFTSDYFNAMSPALTASDYNTFYPATSYTGLNLMNGEILKTDMMAKNGVAHEVSSVSIPLDNIDMLLQNDEYKVFNDVLNFKTLGGASVFKFYQESADVAEYMKKIMPDENIDKVYVKFYDNKMLSFSPSFENIINPAGTAVNESGNYTLFVPSNTALTNYINTKLLKYYEKISDMPIEVLATLINTHMSNDAVWATSFKGSKNSTGEFFNGLGPQGADFSSIGIINKRMASNGFLYTIDHVIKSRMFESVYGEIFLNPNYTLLHNAYTNFYVNSLREDIMKCELNGYLSERFTLLIPSNDLLTLDGYKYNSVTAVFSNDLIKSGNADDRLKRLLRMHLFAGIKTDTYNSEIKDFSGNATLGYNGWGFVNTYYGNVVRYKNNQIQSSGNIEDGSFVTVTLVDDHINGSVFKIDNLLQYSPRWTESAVNTGWSDKRLWNYLDQARTENPNVKLFVDYVQKCIKSPTTDELAGINAESFYTVLMPNNAVMTKALADGVISDGSDPVSLSKTAKFLYGHFLQGRSFADDGYNFLYPLNLMEPTRTLVGSALRITNERLGLANQRTLVEVSKSGDQLKFAPQDIKEGNTLLVKGISTNPNVQRGCVVAATDNFKSNRIAGRSILHEVDGYIYFEEQSN